MLEDCSEADRDVLTGNRVSLDVVAQIRRDAVARAGSADDMALRAASYHDLYKSSGRSFAFAIIAAHGALWARWYLQVANAAARLLALADISSSLTHRERVASYQRFVERFREINRLVFIETWVNLHLLRLDRDHPLVSARMPEQLRHEIAGAHEAAMRGLGPDNVEMRLVYEQYFRWEQVVVVGPLVQEAVNEFHWELAKWFCRRPWVWFSYFRLGRALVFRDFTDAEERTQKGLAAFDWAASKGWDRIERNLLANPLYVAANTPRPRRSAT